MSDPPASLDAFFDAFCLNHPFWSCFFCAQVAMSKATITTRPINKMATKNTKIAPERGRSMAAITIARMTATAALWLQLFSFK